MARCHAAAEMLINCLYFLKIPYIVLKIKFHWIHTFAFHFIKWQLQLVLWRTLADILHFKTLNGRETWKLCKSWKPRCTIMPLLHEQAWDRAKQACQNTTDFSIFQQIETNSGFRRCTQQTLLNVFLICGKNVFTAGALYFSDIYFLKERFLSIDLNCLFFKAI